MLKTNRYCDDCENFLLLSVSIFHCFFFFFVFAEPSAEIIGSKDVYIDRGSTINLTCIIHNSPEPPAYIFWNHNNAVSLLFFYSIMSDISISKFYVLGICCADYYIR